jgi:hypothetical protein
MAVWLYYSNKMYVRDVHKKFGEHLEEDSTKSTGLPKYHPTDNSVKLKTYHKSHMIECKSWQLNCWNFS